MNILILDDDEIMLDVFTRVIQRVRPEANVICVKNQKDAFGVLDSIKVDLAIIDRHGCGGCVVGLRAVDLKIRTVLCTGDHTEILGFEEVLLKPFDLNEFEALLR